MRALEPAVFRIKQYFNCADVHKEDAPDGTLESVILNLTQHFHLGTVTG
jgi:hypothetical protein